MLEARGLGYRFQAASPLFHDLNLPIVPGVSLGILGPSGSGKSTLLGLLSGRLSPQEGEVLFEGKPVITTGRDLTLEKDFLFSLEQGIGLPAYRSVRELFRIRLRHLPNEELDERIEAVSRDFGIEGLMAQNTQTLSLGQAQRIGLALGVSLPDQLILLDEPFSHQDPLNWQRLLFQLILYKHKHNLTYIVASHSAEDCMILTDRCLYLEGNGNIETFANWHTFFAAASEPRFQAYFEYVSGAPLLFGAALPDLSASNKIIETKFLGVNQLLVGYDENGNPTLKLKPEHTP